MGITKHTDIHPQRNGFVTFWMWLSIIFCLISLSSCVLELVSDKGIWTRYPDKDIFNYTSILCNVIAVVSYVMLLKWRKLGYFLLLITSILIIVVGTSTHKINRSEIELIVTWLPFISVLVLSLIFFIKKDGNSTWKYLFNKL